MALLTLFVLLCRYRAERWDPSEPSCSLWSGKALQLWKVLAVSVHHRRGALWLVPDGWRCTGQGLITGESNQFLWLSGLHQTLKSLALGGLAWSGMRSRSQMVYSGCCLAFLKPMSYETCGHALLLGSWMLWLVTWQQATVSRFCL